MSQNLLQWRRNSNKYVIPGLSCVILSNAGYYLFILFFIEFLPHSNHFYEQWENNGEQSGKRTCTYNVMGIKKNEQAVTEY